jgi:hypothetical protein
MQRLTKLSNKWQKRTLRVLYGQTQAYPYGATLDPSLRNSDKSFRKPLSTDSTGGGFPLTRSADAYTLKNGLVPGTVVVKGAGEGIVVANGANAAVKPFGLLANFVGGELDDTADENSVGVWRGIDSVYEVLAPAFDDTGLATAYTSATAGNPVKLYAQADGRLGATSPGGSALVVAELVERVSQARIVIDLKV